jgi:hypothetical protein
MDGAARLLTGGLFDEAYYRRCYDQVLPSGGDALGHFLADGWQAGFKPCAAFDPIVYRLLHPHVVDANPAIDALERYGPGTVPAHGVEAIVPSELRLSSTKGTTQVADDPAFNLERAHEYGQETAIPFEVDGKAYSLRVPPTDAVLGRIAEDKPFAMARISQGDWDALWAFEHYVRKLAVLPLTRHLPENHLRALAARLCDAWHHAMDVYAEHFLVEFYADLRARTRHPDFLHGVAFKGYPTADERLFEWSAAPTPEDKERLALFASFFAPDETIYEATIWKRWIISGELRDLPALARRRPVILMAGGILADLGERWQLKWFLHVGIPLTHAYELRNALLEQCRAKVAEAKAIARRENTARPLFLMQGSSFAYWFMKRLFATDPDIFYIDVGQALHPWFFDRHEIPLRNWGRLYGPAIVENNALDEFYRTRGVSEPISESLFGKRLRKSGSAG